jgi:hypothetical protein
MEFHAMARIVKTAEDHEKALREHHQLVAQEEKNREIRLARLARMKVGDYQRVGSPHPKKKGRKPNRDEKEGLCTIETMEF